MKFHRTLHPVATLLRGRYGSMRQRFIRMPIQRIRLRVHLLRGRSWIDFYRDLLDGYVESNISKETSEGYLQHGEIFLKFLVKHGLSSTDRVLDYGCGVLRAAHYLVPYLHDGIYVGLDISPNRIQRGKEILQRAGIATNQYQVFVTENCLLEELKGHTFDVVWANSVLTHMPEADIRQLLVSLKAYLAPEARFFFTFSPSERLNEQTPRQLKIKDFYYPTEYLRNIFLEYGYTFDVLTDGHYQHLQSPTVKATVADSFNS